MTDRGAKSISVDLEPHRVCSGPLEIALPTSPIINHEHYLMRVWSMS